MLIDASKGAKKRYSRATPTRASITKSRLDDYKAGRRDFTYVEFYKSVSLKGVDFSGADFRVAGFTDVNMEGANLCDTDLRNADFIRTKLTRAKWIRADMRETDLTDANLQNADLTGAKLAGATLTGADLTGADLRNADLENANLTDAKGIAWCLWPSDRYDMLGVVVKGEIMIFSGCRMFTLEEAVEHWREGNEEEWTVSSPEWGEERRRGLAHIRNKLEG